MSFPQQPKNKKTVHLDYAAATPVDINVAKKMQPYFTKYFGNPSAIYYSGTKARRDAEKARAMIADILVAHPDEIIFTSGGTEGNNLAILGAAEKHRNQKMHIVATAIEHHSVLQPLNKLASTGYKITYVPPQSDGRVDIKQIMKAVRPDTVLVSVMYANNEIGTINPIAEIGKEILKWRKKNNTIYPFFHTDACQAAGLLDLSTNKLHVDLMTINGSKIYGPKGIGVLYKRRGIELTPQISGGSQERGIRSGTENMPGIIGMAAALNLTQKNKNKEFIRLQKLVEYFWKKIKTIPDVELNGPIDSRLPNNLNIYFEEIEGEALVLYLNEYGIECATGSACASTDAEASHVLMACGLGAVEARGSIRFTIGKYTKKEDINYVMKILPGVVKELRAAAKIK